MVFPRPVHFRKKANWLAALAVEAAAPALRLYAGTHSTVPPSPPASWRKALIIGDNHIGDLLYRSASLDALKRGLPQCQLHYLTAPGSAQILQGHPALDSILPYQTGDTALDLPPARIQELRAMRFDAALSTNCIKYWPELLLALRLGIPNRAGYTYKGFSGFVTHPIPIRFPQPFPAYFRDYVAALTGRPPSWPVRPVIPLTPDDHAQAAALWDKLQLGRYPHIIAAFLTSRQPTGTWPPEKFGQTLAAARAIRPTHILLCGAPADSALLARINSQFDLQADVIAGALSLRALCAFLRHCDAVLTTDSGPRHIANAAGIPVIFIRNTWFHAVEAGVYVDTETDLCPVPAGGGIGHGPALLATIDPKAAAATLAALQPVPAHAT